jgi:hypothetical protein
MGERASWVALVRAYRWDARTATGPWAADTRARYEHEAARIEREHLGSPVLRIEDTVPWQQASAWLAGVLERKGMTR